MNTRFIRLLILSILALIFALELIQVSRSFGSEAGYRKDFVGFYLMGKAALAGVNVYTPLPELAQRFGLDLGSYYPHPSAYPLPVLFLASPFALMPYFMAGTIWTAGELAWLAIAAVLLTRRLGGWSAPPTVWGVLLIFAVGQPVFSDLYQGQIMMLATLLLTASWLLMRDGRQIPAGLLLGVLLALKLYGWAFIPFLLITKRIKAAAVALLMFVALNLLSSYWFGLGELAKYYTVVGPMIGEFYQQHPLNLSAFAFGSRIGGISVGLILTGTVFCISLGAAIWVRDFDRGFLIIVVASTILGPVSWQHYFVTLLPALLVLAAKRDMRISELVWKGLILACLIPSWSENQWSWLLERSMGYTVVVALVITLLRRELVPCHKMLS